MNRPQVLGRRRAMATLAGSAIGGALAGCADEPAFPDADVIAGPGDRLTFEPRDLRVAVGTTVTWGFASSGHNVSCRRGDADGVRLPDGAVPFASYGPEASPRRLVPRGETYAHTIETPGEYTYVCVPHVQSGMVGTIAVE